MPNSGWSGCTVDSRDLKRTVAGTVLQNARALREKGLLLGLLVHCLDLSNLAQVFHFQHVQRRYCKRWGVQMGDLLFRNRQRQQYLVNREEQSKQSKQSWFFSFNIQPIAYKIELRYYVPSMCCTHLEPIAHQIPMSPQRARWLDDGDPPELMI